MFRTLDMSHFERSPLNNVASRNISLISVTRDTSHSPIGPCGPLEQSPCGHILMCASTAVLSSALDCGENTGVVAHTGLLKLFIPHAPLQQCGEMLIRSIRNGIQRCDGKRICTWRCVSAWERECDSVGSNSSLKDWNKLHNSQRTPHTMHTPHLLHPHFPPFVQYRLRRTLQVFPGFIFNSKRNRVQVLQFLRVVELGQLVSSNRGWNPLVQTNTRRN